MNSPESAHSGDSLSLQPHSKLLAYGEQISRALADHVDTMLQYSAEQIVSIIKEGRAIIVLNGAQSQECLAFAQISPWNDNASKPVAIEFRSWKSWSHDCGILALYGGVELSKQKYPGVPMYAVVEASNTKAQRKLLQAGATICDYMPQGMRIELGEGEAQCIIFDIFSLGGRGI